MNAPGTNVDPSQTRLLKEYKHSSPLLGCRMDPTGQFAFAGAQDNTIERWHLASGKKTAFVGPKSWVRGLAFSPNGKVLFAGDYTGRLWAWPSEGDIPKPVWNVVAHQGWVRALAVHKNGKLLATCGNDNRVKLWDPANGKLVREFVGHSCHVYNVAFHPNGQQLVSADLKGIVKQWDLDRGTLLRDLDASELHKYDKSFHANIGGIRGMAFSSDGSMLACAGITEVTNAFAGVGKPLVVLFDMQSGKRKQMLVPKENFQGTAWGVVFHSAGFIAGVGGGNGGALWFWKPEQAQAFFTLKLADNARDLDLHPDGQRLGIAFADGAFRSYTMGPKKT